MSSSNCVRERKSEIREGLSVPLTAGGFDGVQGLSVRVRRPDSRM